MGTGEVARLYTEPACLHICAITEKRLEIIKLVCLYPTNRNDVTHDPLPCFQFVLWQVKLFLDFPYVDFFATENDSAE